MTWSLELRNGDLTLDGARLGQTNNANKLVQDIRCALLEPRGHDDMHPSYGSIIDGGYDDYGRYVPTVVGTSDWERAELQIRTEVQRVCGLYQQQQIARANKDRQKYGRSTISPAELLLSVENINMVQAQDKLLVTITLQTGAGSTFDISVPLYDASLL